MTISDAPIIEARNITRDYPGVRALTGVDLALQPGQVHGIIGENGAGKSTLMKILAGIERPTTGALTFDGQPLHLRSPADAQRLGIVMIHQELNLVDDLTVAENIFLGRESTKLRLLQRRPMNQRAADLLTEIGSSEISPRARVATLSIAQKQMVEIARAMSTQARVLIMDEPTAVLTGREVQSLFKLIDRLKRRGVAIVYISHLLREVLQICDRVTVFRDGRIVQTLDRAALDASNEHDLASLMVGRPIADYFPPRTPATTEILADFQHISSPGRVHDVSFSVHRGEIFGLAGLIGAGRTELAEAIVALRPRSAGSIAISGQDVSIDSPTNAIRAGIAYLSEDRKSAGLNLSLPIYQNTTLVNLRQYGTYWLHRRRELAATRAHAEHLHLKTTRLRAPVSTLSGGNQQKVLLAKWLETSPKLLIIDEPTRGVDVGAKEEIYRLIQSLTATGMACILISSEMTELLGLCHRIAVMRKGAIVATLDGASATEDQIVQYATGARAGESTPTP